MASLPPRLLTEEQAADYLGGLPLTAVRRLNFGRVLIEGRVRFDRAALDAHLDRLSGLACDPPPPAAAGDPDDADAALARFLAVQTDAARTA